MWGRPNPSIFISRPASTGQATPATEQSSQSPLSATKSGATAPPGAEVPRTPAPACRQRSSSLKTEETKYAACAELHDDQPLSLLREHLKPRQKKYKEATLDTSWYLYSANGSTSRPSPGLDRFSDGEFDPGSGRTLVACLTHASRTLSTFGSHERVANG